MKTFGEIEENVTQEAVRAAKIAVQNSLAIEGYIDPVIINERVFELYDIPAAFAAIKHLLQKSSNKPKEAKRSAAKFLKSCMEQDLVNYDKSLMCLCNTILS